MHLQSFIVFGVIVVVLIEDQLSLFEAPVTSELGQDDTGHIVRK